MVATAESRAAKAAAMQKVEVLAELEQLERSAEWLSRSISRLRQQVRDGWPST